jgi:hypothetical protein
VAFLKNKNEKSELKFPKVIKHQNLDWNKQSQRLFTSTPN